MWVWVRVLADFLSPSVAADAMVAVNGLADVRGILFGGYAMAERCRWVVCVACDYLVGCCVCCL